MPDANQPTVTQRQPRVSALINTFNYARFLPLAINSVLRQGYSNMEIVVVDDGSTDETPEIMARYGDKIRGIRTKNGGQANAFNVGIPACTGELIMMLDADDIWLPGKVARMVELAAANPHAGMLYHRYMNINSNGFELDKPQPYVLIEGNWRQRFIRSGGAYWHTITSTMVLRPEFILPLLPIPTYPLREGADSVISDLAPLLTEIASTGEVLAHRRLHGSNLYAAEREHFLRAPTTRADDVRRVEWRHFIVDRIMRRIEAPVSIDLDRNEWRMINLYLLDRASYWQMVRACMLNSELANPFKRLKRARWFHQVKRMHGKSLVRKQN